MTETNIPGAINKKEPIDHKIPEKNAPMKKQSVKKTRRQKEQQQ